MSQYMAVISPSGPVYLFDFAARPLRCHLSFKDLEHTNVFVALKDLGPQGSALGAVSSKTSGL